MGLYQNRHNNFKPDLSQTPQAQSQIWVFWAAAELQHSTNAPQWSKQNTEDLKCIVCPFRHWWRNSITAVLDVHKQLQLSWYSGTAYSSIMSILDAHLADQRVNWRQLLSQTELVWWATGMSGSPSRWLPWSAGKPPGSPSPRFPDSSQHSQVPARSWRPPSVLPHDSSDNLWKKYG